MVLRKDVGSHDPHEANSREAVVSPTPDLQCDLAADTRNVLNHERHQAAGERIAVTFGDRNSVREVHGDNEWRNRFCFGQCLGPRNDGRPLGLLKTPCWLTRTRSLVKFRYFNSDPTGGRNDANIRLTDRLEIADRLAATKTPHLLDELQFFSFLCVASHRIQAA